jgi:hypothetical protein
MCASVTADEGNDEIHLRWLHKHLNAPEENLAMKD